MQLANKSLIDDLSSGQSLKIMIVDDDLDILSSVKDLLEIESEDYEVKTASSYDEAVSLASDFKPDLALLDIKLGSHYGIELVPILKNEVEDIICIVITAYRDTKYTIDALRSGADDFIYKPLEPEHLFKTVRQFQQSQRLLRDKVLTDRRFRTLFNNSFEYLFILDQTGKVIDVNDVSLRFMKKNKQDLLGLNFFELPWWGDNEGSRQKIIDLTRSCQNGNSLRLECTVISADGNDYIMDFSVKPVLDDNGDTIMIIPEARDITDLKRKEEKIISLNHGLEEKVKERTRELEDARDEAVRANKAKDIFLSQMSHELRTPMNAILGFTQILEIDKDDPLTEGQADSVHQIHIASDRLMLLINQILEISKLGSSDIRMVPIKFDITDIINESINTYQMWIDDHDINVIKNIDKDAPLNAFVDTGAVQRVMNSILSNAVKFNKKGGSITITSSYPRDGFIRISTTDTGIGIAAENVGKIFNAFDYSRSKNYVNGAGIGLAVSHKLIHAMGGEIGFDSEPGEGTTFWFEVPLANTSD